MKILFFGIYEIGHRTLEKLLHVDDVEIVGVVTKHDTVFQKYSVVEVARKNNLLCYTVKFLKCKYVLSLFNKLKFDLIVVSGFHLKIPAELINFASVAAINLHDSLLPRYKGPNASKWCIINGEDKTGVTIHHLSPKIDEGEIIAQKELTISPSDTAGSLFSKLASIGSELMVEVILLMKKNKLLPFANKMNNSSYYSYPTEEETRIKWDTYDADQICRLIRGLDPSPGAYFMYESYKFRVFDSQIMKKKSGTKPGTILKLSNDSIVVSTLTYDLRIRCIIVKLHQDYSVLKFVDEYKVKTFDRLT